ncbi:helix-turn-helix domain-containing protein [Bailinhaonella thermotolerans]|uniref:XRE family transcriptional regulator n=1 Tax=Bailinhaonella thermotolerans TaxID=1070861 RepID=A0A3A4AYW9_9ACTN|nr:helix-turn-helix transcriptional regulator [Bailinhaonella thermotolerans]RJL30440.1 XRE family transcriptional regulator [Bailinhaonella thermotolerans]
MDLHSPTIRRRRLSSELRRLRQESGMTADEVSRRLDWSAGKLTRMERNEWRRPSVRDVTDLLNVYGVTDEKTRTALETLARQARDRGWWADYRDVFRGSLPEFEAEASAIRTYEALLVPGLLQTPEYAAAIIRGGRVIPESEVDRRVAARMVRQRLLDRPDPPAYWAIVDEAALRKSVGGPEVMRGQLQHLIAMSERPNIDVQVLTDAAGAHSSMTGGMLILDFPADPSIVYIETVSTDLYFEEVEDLQRYALRYDHVRAAALSVEASVEYLTGLLRRIEEG